VPIDKGQEWGRPGVLPAASPIAGSDAEAAALVGSHELIGLRGGDLARTLGVSQHYERGTPKQLVGVDAIEIVLDSGEVFTCLAHAVIGTPFVDRKIVAVMNAAFIGRRNIAPRAHPGDGKADVVSVGLGLADSFKAWRRMLTASHLPHPHIAVRRQESGVADVGASKPVRIDGQRVGSSKRLRFRVLPEAITIAVS